MNLPEGWDEKARLRRLELRLRSAEDDQARGTRIEVGGREATRDDLFQGWLAVQREMADKGVHAIDCDHYRAEDVPGTMHHGYLVCGTARFGFRCLSLTS